MGAQVSADSRTARRKRQATASRAAANGSATSAESEPLVILADTREQVIPPFPPGVVVERRMMKEADYTTLALFDIARIERKSVCDLASTITWGRERFDREVQRLQALRWKAVVVEGEPHEIYRVSAVHPHSVIGTIASLLARYDTPVLFAVNPVGAGRLMAGLLRRWEERLAAERGQAA
jgi:ERCC4-type nuclease